ncbi:LamG-like jellyroll fold domain-containing protein [Actinoplanes sp. NPDC051411]|uniref:LamG-like jellyroll fold domain-containing protein n=1 Tax=Actinoplanes sp. NPDC051411 TaxID=3155522 RepID=UPI003437AA7D
MRRDIRRATSVAGLLIMAMAAAIARTGPVQAVAADKRPPMVLAVDLSKPIKPVDQAASGSLYGIADEGWPADHWIAGIKPKMFTQPPPGATHQPNGEPAPVGDTLKVWPVAKRNGATVTIRLPDIFPSFPYVWQGDDYWYSQVERMVRARVASGADNIYGYEIWNEPQWTWNPAWGDFNEMWARTYRLIRSLDPGTPIIGPSYDRDYEVGLRPFLTAAIASGTVPDIVSWHELGPMTGLQVETHVQQYRALEKELGVGPLPISINEYGSPRDAGVPGWLTRFVAKLERAKVDTADLAFWHKPGRLGDLLVPEGGGSGPAYEADPTGNYWLYKWYGDMTGDMVTVTPPAPTARYIEVGTPVPAEATRIAGREGTAIPLNGDAPNQYVSMPAGVLKGVGDFTVSAWVNLRSVADWARIFDFGTGTAVNMFLTPRAGGAGLRFSINAGGVEQQINGTAPLPTGWTHVAVTKSGTTGTLYVNGEPAGTNPNMTLGPSDLNGGDTTNNWIGKSQYADPLLDATVDDFNIYDHALSSAQLRDLMTTPGVGNVLSYHFDEAPGTTVPDASGNGRDGTVTTGVTGVDQLPAPDGFASVDRHDRTARVVFGGGSGDLQLKVGGLGFGGRASVQVYATEWTGTDGVSAGPVPVFGGTYRVHDGAISVPVQDIDETTAYLAVIRPATGPVLPGPRHEATGGRSHTSPLASENAYVTGDEFTFTVRAPQAGAYDLAIRYTGGGVEGTIAGKAVAFPATGGFATVPTTAVLRRGINTIKVKIHGGTLGLDYLQVTPFRERVQAESGQWTDANLVRINMDESNFFAPYVSGNAYVADFAKPTSTLRLPITVPAAGRYRLKVGYSTAGTEEERRAQTKAGQLVRVGDGPWQQISFDPTQFRELIRQTTVTVNLPAGTSTLTFTKADQPGTVDLDYVDVLLG